MRNTLILFLVLTTAAMKAQRDSSTHVHKNAVSIEMGGTSFAFFGYGSPFNVSYQRLFQLKKDGKASASIRIGAGTFQSGYSPPQRVVRQVFIPLEANIFFGGKILKGDFGLAYTAMFGENFIIVPDQNGNGQLVSLYYYDFVNVRIGAAIVPKRWHFPYVRAAWMPIYVPKHNPYPIEEAERLEDHFGWRLLWGGVSIGAMF